jgi:cytidylate kinase
MLQETIMTLNPLVIAGPFGAGKDHAAAVISDALTREGITTAIYEVGSYYYEQLAAMNGISVKQIRAHKPRYRRQLQDIGSDPAQQARAVSRALASLEENRRRGIMTIVTARKPAEIQPLRDAGARAIALDAPLAVRMQRVGLRDGAQPSASEASHCVEIDATTLPVDVIVPNGENAGELHAAFVRGKLYLRNDIFGHGLALDRQRFTSPGALRLGSLAAP